MNLDAAKVLIDKSLYAPSIHCSYYSCFQLMKFVMFDFFGITYEVLGSIASQSGKKTHEYMIGHLSTELERSGIDIRERMEFNRKIRQLKSARQDSDYEDEPIDSSKGEKAFLYANEINLFLNKTFHV